MLIQDVSRIFSIFQYINVKIYNVRDAPCINVTGKR